jgi:hypothetical protein
MMSQEARMPEKDQIAEFIRGLYSRGKRCYSKQEILTEARKQIKESEGYEHYFEQLPDHDYDEISLMNAIASLSAR